MDALAPELVDHIIDCICCDSVDEDAMKSWGLLARKWRRRTRYHLFSRVSLNAQNLGAFINLVETSSLPILSFVRNLELEYHGTSLDATLLTRLHRCPNLVRIYLHVLDPTGDGAVWINSHALYHHLRSWNDSSGSISHLDVRLASSVELPLRAVINLLSCVPCIQKLGIYGASRLAKDSDVYPDSSFAPSVLRHLDLESLDGGAELLGWLLSLAALPKLKSLRFSGFVYGDDTQSIEAVEAYLRRAGDEVESLEIRVRGRWADAVHFQRRILLYMPKLRNFVFTCPSTSMLLQTLSLLPASGCLQAIHATVHDPEDSDILVYLDTELAKPAFRILEKFSLKSTRNIITAQTRHLMPLANARGILV